MVFKKDSNKQHADSGNKYLRLQTNRIKSLCIKILTLAVNKLEVNDKRYFSRIWIRYRIDRYILKLYY